MLKTKWIVIEHTWWEHYGATPTKKIFSTREEAEAAKAAFESVYKEDGYYTSLYTQKEVVLTPEEEFLRSVRKAAKSSFDYHKDSLCFGLYHHWDGSTERFFLTMDIEGSLYIHFPKDHKKMIIGDEYSSKKNKFFLSQGEELHVLGGDSYWVGKIPTLIYNWGSIPPVEE